MLFETSKGAVPMACSILIEKLSSGHREGAGKFTLVEVIAEKGLASDRVRKQISFIVDVDDKNCLAQLTVAPKLNQGVRQRLYIVAGVLLFVTFFCTSKRK